MCGKHSVSNLLPSPLTFKFLNCQPAFRCAMRPVANSSDKLYCRPAVNSPTAGSSLLTSKLVKHFKNNFPDPPWLEFTWPKDLNKDSVPSKVLRTIENSNAKGHKNIILHDI